MTEMTMKEKLAELADLAGDQRNGGHSAQADAATALALIERLCNVLADNIEECE